MPRMREISELSADELVELEHILSISSIIGEVEFLTKDESLSAGMPRLYIESLKEGAKRGRASLHVLIDRLKANRR